MPTGRLPAIRRRRSSTRLMSKANLAQNYFAIAHPSSTNYLEVVGGSNFNDHSDQYPDWHNKNCQPNITPRPRHQYGQSRAPGRGCCPIAGIGTDAPTPAVDKSMNETSTPPLTNINGVGVDSGRAPKSTASRSRTSWCVKANPGSPTRRGLPLDRRGRCQRQRRVLHASAATMPQGSMSPRISPRSRRPAIR